MQKLPVTFFFPFFPSFSSLRCFPSFFLPHSVDDNLVPWPFFSRFILHVAVLLRLQSMLDRLVFFSVKSVCPFLFHTFRCVVEIFVSAWNSTFPLFSVSSIDLRVTYIPVFFLSPFPGMGDTGSFDRPALLCCSLLFKFSGQMVPECWQFFYMMRSSTNLTPPIPVAHSSGNGYSAPPSSRPGVVDRRLPSDLPSFSGSLHRL